MVLELFGTEFKDKLFEELVSLNVKPIIKPNADKADKLHGYRSNSCRKQLAGAEPS